VSAIYADDSHSAGWFLSALTRALLRVREGRADGLSERPDKCVVMTIG